MSSTVVTTVIITAAAMAVSLKLDQLGPFAPPRDCSRNWKQLCAYPIITNIATKVDQAHNPSNPTSITTITNQVNSGVFNQGGFYPWLVRKSDATILASGNGVANLLPINLPELTKAHAQFALAFAGTNGHKWVRFVWHGVNRLGYVLKLDDKHAAVVFFDDKDVPPISSSKCIGATPSSEPACSVYAATRAQASVFYDLLVANSSINGVLTNVTNGVYNALGGFTSPIVVTPSTTYRSSTANYTGTATAPSTANETTPGTLSNGWQTFVGSFPCAGGMCKVLSPFREAKPIIESPTCDQTAGPTPCNLGLAQSIVDSGMGTRPQLEALTGASSFSSVYNYVTKDMFNLKTPGTTANAMTMLINTTLGLSMSESAFMTYIAGRQSMWTLTNNQIFYAKSPLLIAIPTTPFFNANGTNCTAKFAVQSNPQCVMSALGSALVDLLTTTNIAGSGGFLDKVKQGEFDVPKGSSSALRVTVVDGTGMIDASSALVINGRFLGKRLSNIEFFAKDLAAGLFTTGAWFRYDDSSAPIVGYAVGVTGSKKYFLSVQYTDGHSAAPTRGPTTTPTKFPSKNPTVRPSTIPSKHPSAKPTTPYPTVTTTTSENPDGAMSVFLFCVYGLVGVVSLLLI